jgi:hypothetical protein
MEVSNRKGVRRMHMMRLRQLLKMERKREKLLR